MLDTAIKLISLKSITQGELSAQLEFQYSSLPNLDTAINKVIQYLLANGLLQDRRIARDIGERYAEKGNNFIINFMKQRKISSFDIEHTLSLLPDEPTRAWQLTQNTIFQQPLDEKRHFQNPNNIALFFQAGNLLLALYILC